MINFKSYGRNWMNSYQGTKQSCIDWKSRDLCVIPCSVSCSWGTSHIYISFSVKWGWWYYSLFVNGLAIWSAHGKCYISGIILTSIINVTYTAAVVVMIYLFYWLIKCFSFLVVFLKGNFTDSFVVTIIVYTL